MNEIIATPRVLDVAVGVVRKITITGNSDNTIPAIEGFNAEWFDYDTAYYQLDTVEKIVRNHVMVDLDKKVVSKFSLRPDQPFSFYAQTAGYELPLFNCGLGMIFQTGKRSNFGYSRPSIQFPNLYGWALIDNDVNVIPAQQNGQPLEGWRIVSDGSYFNFYRSGVLVHRVVINPEITGIKFFFIGGYAGQRFYNVNVSVPAQIELINAETVTKVFVPSNDLETRIENHTDFYFKSWTAQNRNLILSHPSVPQSVVVVLNVSSVYLRPEDETGTVVQELDIVNFISNAEGGVFTATSGVIVDTDELKWQAIEQGNVTLKYEVNGYSASYDILVIPKIGISNVLDGYYETQAAQGEEIEFRSNVNGEFQCINYPNCITPDGFLVTPSDAGNAQFGKADLQIRFTAYGFNFDFIVKVMPMFPNSKVRNGVIHEHWEQGHPDFLPISRKTVGGRKEARNQNKNGVVTWVVEYSNLRFAVTCAEENRFSAKRLDDFYRLVSTTDYFSVIDIHTSELFKYVTLEEYSGNHEELYSVDQVRSLTMYYDGGDIQL